MKMRKLISLIVLGIVLITIADAQYSTKDIESKIYCPCGCGEILINCHCETAVKERSEINKRLLEGKGADEIINRYVTLYGSNILVNEELEAIKSSSRKSNQNMLYFYIIGLAITGFIAYNIGKSKRGKGGSNKKSDENGKWKL